MSFKTLLFCAQAILIQSIACQCMGPYNALPFDGLPYGAPYGSPYGAPYGAPCAGPLAAPYVADLPFAPFVPASGGNFAVSSTSPLVPSGIKVVSENTIEGPLSVGGILPFLGTVALEAVLPTAGAGTVSYGCGNGAVGITAEDYGYPAGPYGPGPYGPGPYGPGLAGPGLAGPGYPGYGPGYAYGPGCGPIY